MNQIAGEIAEVPHQDILQDKEVLNTDLEIMGAGALFRYHGQHNALGRIVTQALGRRWADAEGTLSQPFRRRA